MISHLTGTVLEIGERSLTLDVRGVGYELFATKPERGLCVVGEDRSFFIQTIVREDALLLYGFSTRSAKNFFNLLLTVSKIGPKSALSIMEEPLEKIKGAISRGDAQELSSIPGIGKKTAQRIVIDLKDKIEADMETKSEAVAADTPAEIIDALMRMGYKRTHVSRILQTMPSEVADEQEIIKYFLRNV